jgi:hypothetical protein
MNWYRKDVGISSLQLPIGSRMVPYFSPADVEAIRTSHNLGHHDDSTILHDFEAFIDENTLTFSYKLIFMLSMLRLADKEGEVNIDSLIEEYRRFYIERLDRGLPVDRPNCAYNREFLDDLVKVKRSILSNPFEKFERKRFMYYSKELGVIAMNHALVAAMDEKDLERVREQMRVDLENYYRNLE